MGLKSKCDWNGVEQILFLTGKLAERGLERILQAMQPVDFTYRVLNIGVNVAALMSAEMINRRLQDVDGIDRIIVPGLCAGDLDQCSRRFGIPILRGPDEMKDLPAFFGQGAKARPLDRYTIRIFAEIVEAPRMEIEAIIKQADAYVRDGADVIDLGCLPAVPFPHLEASIAALRERGYQISVDSLETDDLLRGARSGAHYLLSLKESTVDLAGDVDAVPVLIPERAGDLDSLFRAIDVMLARGQPFLADSVLDPVHFGLTESVVRYSQLRQRYPGIEIMMGTGNLSELTDADTTGLNAFMLGILSELRIDNLLTTQVSAHARSVVRELDVGRRIMFAAREDASLPRGYNGSLLTIHDRKPFPYTESEIAETAKEIRDPSYRVQVSEVGIHVYNRDGMVTARDPFDLFPHLKELASDAPHAFYMGIELARAQLAWQLGKRYMQDEPLQWGCAARDQVQRDPNALHAYKPSGSTRAKAKK